MMIGEEATLYTAGRVPSDWHTYGGGVKESRLKSWKGRKSSWGITFLSRRTFTMQYRVGWLPLSRYQQHSADEDVTSRHGTFGSYVRTQGISLRSC